MDHQIVYLKHDSDNCECCLDFWLGPQTQAREKEELESDTDSGYCSMTQTKDLVPANVPIIPRIIVTPLSDEEQIQHNACIRAALIQRNAFVCTITSTSTTSLATLSNEEKAIPSSSSSAGLSTISLASWKSTTSPASLAPPEESWSHRLKDTYENRMTWPQYFNIPTPLTTTTSFASTSLPPSASSTSIFACALAAPHLRKRASKDALELHPKVLAPVSTSRGQSLRKRWSIAGSGVGFGFGSTTTTTTTTTSTTAPPRTKQGPNSTRSGTSSPTPSPTSKSPTTQPATTTTPPDSTCTYTFKRRSRATSTQSLNDKPTFVASSTSAAPSLALPSQTGGPLGRWGRAMNSATGNSLGGGGTGTGTNSSGAGAGGGGGGGGAFGKSMRSLKTLYSNAPSSFRML